MNIYAGRVSIVGVTGYAGQELDRILALHPRVIVNGRYASKADESLGVEAFSMESLKKAAPDVVILATEHEFSMQQVPEMLAAGYRVLDMSGAFRMKDPSLYPIWYGFEHSAPALLGEAVYGLPEFFADQIGKARLVSNPGCYATAAILPLRPLYEAKAIDPACTVVVDGKSGVSGAGKQPKPETHFVSVSENIRAYGVLKHRHTPEMITWLPGATVDNFVFTPHLIPINRGILNTIVFRHAGKVSVRKILTDVYGPSSFVRVLPEGRLPDIHGVVRTNNCTIGIVTRGAVTVIVSAIDNLVKGASGQAVENLNLMLGCDPMAGLS
jgi:N-acetyl-gamma-glutamyl-phosphate reductase